jgi:soluble lytic murein transglycosylase-like protein
MRDRALTFPVMAARSVPVRPAGDRGIGPTIPTRARPAETGGVAQTILASARQHQLDPLLVRAVMLTESAGKPHATSPQGARGLMQLMPATAARFGVADPDDPAQNIGGGTRYLRWLLDRYGGNVPLALAGYNAGEGAVDRHDGIPPYRETRHYVWRVQATRAVLGRILAQKLARAGQKTGE